jgi:MSHA pilin protein MshD
MNLKWDNPCMLKNEQGLTLLELVLIIVVLAVGLTGVLTYFIQGTKDSSYAQNTAVATVLAQDLMEEIRSKCWDQTATTVSPCNGAVTPSATLGPDGGEMRATYNDVDDFNGLSNNPPQNSLGASMTQYPIFRQIVLVCYVPGTNLNDTSACATPTNYKRIDVRVCWSASCVPGTGDLVELVSVATNH